MLSRLLDLATAACFWVVVGCAAPSGEPPGSEWITARVVQVRRAGEPGMAANMRCVEQAAHDDTSTIAVVRYRSAHMARDRALIVPSADAVRVGDVVAVDTQRCVLRREPVP